MVGFIISSFQPSQGLSDQGGENGCGMQEHKGVRKCMHTFQTQKLKRKDILVENGEYEGIMASWGLLDQRMSRIIFMKNCITALLVVWCAFLPIASLWCVKSVVKERYCVGGRAYLRHKFLFRMLCFTVR
jgi:hypothetical protein